MNLSRAAGLTAEQLALRTGILSGAIFPIITLAGLLTFKNKLAKKREEKTKRL